MIEKYRIIEERLKTSDRSSNYRAIISKLREITM